MKRNELAHARHHAYTVFSQLFLEGVTAVTFPYAAAIPELATHLSIPFNEDDWAAAHYNLFHMNLFPFESLYFAEDGLLGGAVTTVVLTHYQQEGFIVDNAAIAPDHIGQELAFLAFLCEAEADAWEDALTATAVSLQQRQQAFLKTHLLTWLLPFSHAIISQEQPFFHVLIDLTIQLAVDHLSEEGASAEFSRKLPSVPNLLANESTELKDIAVFITTPPYSGFFISRDNISHIARMQQLPRGFGSRSQMLTNLMKTAVQYDTLPQLLTQLVNFVKKQENNLTKQQQEFCELTPFAQVWINRCQQTIQLLQNISKQARMP
jgi:putative dimethyl sulfoxide reductase chaperone